MSFLDIVPNLSSIKPNLGALQESAIKTAGYQAGLAAAQLASPFVVKAAQNIFNQMGLIDAVLGQGIYETPLELLGGLTPKMASDQMASMRALRPLRKNVWFIRVTDPKPKGLVGPSISDELGTLNFLALDVSYSTNGVQGDKAAIGSAVMDRIHGGDHTELSITTLDDSAGTIKRWFQGKQRQAIAVDGTFGLPVDYCVTIEVVHGVPNNDVTGADLAFRSHLRMRPGSMPLELSRRDHGFAEIQLSFSQFDTFYPVK
jgi:hypothetical protein